jgi:hypothetical protein
MSHVYRKFMNAIFKYFNMQVFSALLLKSYFYIFTYESNQSEKKYHIIF